jgi:hypothetical protein
VAVKSTLTYSCNPRYILASLLLQVLSGACGTPQQYDQALAALVPSHSTPLSRRHSAICLSKAARRIYYALHPEEIPAPDPDHDPPGASPSLEAGYVDVGTRYLSLQLQPGRVLYDRFSKAEAAQLWAYYRHVRTIPFAWPRFDPLTPLTRSNSVY